ncbi:MAG: type IX secretion system outer membrane channel protein PorV [Bacteroidota bacterium]
MKRHFTCFTCLIFIFYPAPAQFGSQQLAAQSNPITTAVPFLSISPDPRAGALGDAGAATTPDVWSTHWNASKLAFSEKTAGAGLSYTPWMRALVPDIDMIYISAFIKPHARGALSASFRYYSLGRNAARNIAGATAGQAGPFHWAGDISYALLVSQRLSVAAGFRYIYSDLTNGILFNGTATRAGVSLAADLSANYRRRGALFAKPAIFSSGIAVSNLGNKISYTSGPGDFIPANLRLGQAADLLIDAANTLSFCLDLNKLLVPTPPHYYATSTGYVIAAGKDPDVSAWKGALQSFHDAPGGVREELNEIMICGGLEYWHGSPRLLAVRTGYFYEARTKGDRKYFTFGIGIRFMSFGLDFSYIVPKKQNNPLQNTLRFALSFDLDRKPASDRKTDT